MSSWVGQTLANLSDSPVAQAIVAMVGTFFAEDPTTVTCGLLIADGAMSFWAAYIGLAIGIAFGDVSLYTMGRLAGPKVITWGLMSHARFGRVRQWFLRNMVLAIIVSRFVPGLRIPTFAGAGVLRAPIVRFLFLVILASLMWTFFLLNATMLLGEMLFPILGPWRWPIVITFLGGLVLFQVISVRRARRDTAREEAPIPGPLQQASDPWPAWVGGVTTACLIIGLALRHGDYRLPFVVNGPLQRIRVFRESKSRLLHAVTGIEGISVMPWATWRRPAGTGPCELARSLRATLRESALRFPLVAKPDGAAFGAGVRLFTGPKALLRYVRRLPEESRLVLQELNTDPWEIWVYYARKPAAESGELFGVVAAQIPMVTGDGTQTLRQIIEARDDSPSEKRRHFRQNHGKLMKILPQGEHFPLVISASSLGPSSLKDAKGCVTPTLERLINDLAKALPGFHFGRFDFRVQSLDDLRQARNLRLFQVNGAGATPLAHWRVASGFRDGMSRVLHHYRLVFEIGGEQLRRGARQPALRRVVRDLVSTVRAWRSYPPST